jgi:NADH:ubiquinone oxidoreductase subunit K
MTLSNFLVVSALLFAIGAYGVLSRRNAIAVLMGVELMLNAANLNFLAFWRYLAPTSMEPQVFVLIGITIAAAEAAVGLAVVLNVYRDFGTVNVEEIETMKG